MARKERNRKNVSETIALIGEGITERTYFRQLIQIERLHSFKIKPDLPQHPDISNYEKKIKNYINKDFDKIYCIIDLDNIYKKQSEKEKYKKIKKAYPNIIFIENNPCFEIWFLLHFNFSTRDYNSDCKEVIKYLKKKLQIIRKLRDIF